MKPMRISVFLCTFAVLFCLVTPLHATLYLPPEDYIYEFDASTSFEFKSDKFKISGSLSSSEGYSLPSTLEMEVSYNQTKGIVTNKFSAVEDVNIIKGPFNYFEILNEQDTKVYSGDDFTIIEIEPTKDGAQYSFYGELNLA